MKKIITLCLAFFILGLNAHLQAESAHKIMLKTYKLDSGKDSKTDMKMEIIKKSGKRRVREVTYWTLERGDEDKSLMYFRKPVADRGVSFLSWEHKNKDDDQWLYLPSLKRVRRISASEKDKSFMGTDFSYNDMTQTHPDEFVHKCLGQEKVDGADCYKIESIHKTYTDNAAYKEKDKYQYSKSISWIRKDNSVMIKGRMFNKKGRVIKQYRAREVQQVQGIWTPMILEMENIKKRHRTILTLIKVKYNIGLKNRFFSQRQLKKKR